MHEKGVGDIDIDMANLNLKETILAIQEAVSRCTCSERELYEELHALSEGWRMRLEEIDEEDKY